MLGSVGALGESEPRDPMETAVSPFLDDEFCGTSAPPVLNCPKTLAAQCLCFLNQDNSSLIWHSESFNLGKNRTKVRKPKLPVRLLPDFEIAVFLAEWNPRPSTPPPRCTEEI